MRGVPATPATVLPGEPVAVRRQAATATGRGVRCDVVVAGGGPAGCAAALALRRGGCRVVVADAGYGRPKVGEALVAMGGVVLADLGVGAGVLGDGHLPYLANMAAWGSPHLTTTDLIRDPLGPGWHLDRAVFERRLREAVRAAGAEVREGTAVRGAERLRDGGWRVRLRDGGGEETVHCAWLVDATGRRAALAVRDGARRHRADRLTCLVAMLAENPGASDGCSLVEAVEGGWWYTALLPSRRRTVMFFTDADLPEAALPTPEEFTARLLATRHTAERARDHGLVLAEPLWRTTAHGTHLDRSYGPGWTAAGDAAFAADPLSAQGILTALYLGACAGQAVAEQLRGAPGAMVRYAERVGTAHAAYLQGHRDIYGREKRWPEHPFWARRQVDPLTQRGVDDASGDGGVSTLTLHQI